MCRVQAVQALVHFRQDLVNHVVKRTTRKTLVAQGTTPQLWIDSNKMILRCWMMFQSTSCTWYQMGAFLVRQYHWLRRSLKILRRSRLVYLHACCWNAPAWFCVGNKKSKRSFEVYLFEFICVSLSGRGYWRRARCTVCVAHWVDSLLSSCRSSCARNCLPETIWVFQIGLPPELRYEQFVSETSANIKVSSDRYSEECKPLPTEQTCQKTCCFFFPSLQAKNSEIDGKMKEIAACRVWIEHERGLLVCARLTIFSPSEWVFVSYLFQYIQWILNASDIFDLRCRMVSQVLQHSNVPIFDWKAPILFMGGTA